MEDQAYCSEIPFHRETISLGVVSLKKIDMAENPADMLIKYLPTDRFELCLDLLTVIQH